MYCCERIFVLVFPVLAECSQVVMQLEGKLVHQRHLEDELNLRKSDKKRAGAFRLPALCDAVLSVELRS